MPPKRKPKLTVPPPPPQYVFLPAEIHFLEKYTNITDEDGYQLTVCQIIKAVLEQDDLVRFILNDDTRMVYSRLEVITVCCQIVKRCDEPRCVVGFLCDELHNELMKIKPEFGYNETERLHLNGQLEHHCSPNKSFR